jgi:hypothetical protein
MPGLHGRRLATAVLALLLAAPCGSARATTAVQKRAKALGYPANGCAYCHSFDTDHMREAARRAGINNMNCMTCHGSQLPKMGKALFNARGQWLLEQKRVHEASRADPAWLADYKEPARKVKPPASSH